MSKESKATRILFGSDLSSQPAVRKNLAANLQYFNFSKIPLQSKGILASGEALGDIDSWLTSNDFYGQFVSFFADFKEEKPKDEKITAAAVIGQSHIPHTVPELLKLGIHIIFVFDVTLAVLDGIFETISCIRKAKDYESFCELIDDSSILDEDYKQYLIEPSTTSEEEEGIMSAGEAGLDLQHLSFRYMQVKKACERVTICLVPFDVLDLGLIQQFKKRIKEALHINFRYLSLTNVYEYDQNMHLRFFIEALAGDNSIVAFSESCEWEVINSFDGNLLGNFNGIEDAEIWPRNVDDSRPGSIGYFNHVIDGFILFERRTQFFKTLWNKNHISHLTLAEYIFDGIRKVLDFLIKNPIHYQLIYQPENISRLLHIIDKSLPQFYQELEWKSSYTSSSATSSRTSVSHSSLSDSDSRSRSTSATISRSHLQWIWNEPKQQKSNIDNAASFPACLS